MPLDWKDMLFSEQAEAVLGLFELTPSEREEIQSEWSEELFEVDKVVFHGNARHILDGRNDALLALQTLCEKRVQERGEILDRRAEMRKRMIDGNSDSLS